MTRAAAEVARDIASLQAVLVRALREELAENDPERFADAVEQLVDAAGAIQAAVTEELVRIRSRELESQANTDALTGLGNLRALQREMAHMLDCTSATDIRSACCSWTWTASSGSTTRTATRPATAC